MGEVIQLIRLKGRDAFIAHRAKELSGKKELTVSLIEAIEIIKGQPEEMRANSDMEDMEKMLARFAPWGEDDGDEDDDGTL